MTTSILQDIEKALLEIKENAKNNDLDKTGPGQDLFELFCKLGCDSINGPSGLELENNQINRIAQLVADIQDWLLLFLNRYPDTIDLDEFSDYEVWDLTTRSGVQFLFDLFNNVQVINPGESEYNIASNVAKGASIKLSTIFKDLESYVEYIDLRLGLAKKRFYRIQEEQVPVHMPKSHHWWWWP